MTRESRVPVAQVDVFTRRPYAGNPAAVCLLDRAPDDVWMANVAREMGCSNTAFVRVRPDCGGYDLRWLTAGGIEVNLCGHATLAAAHLLYEQEVLGTAEVLRFHTRGGLLTAMRLPDETIEIDLPCDAAQEIADPPQQIAAGLGCRPMWVGRNRLDYVIEVADEATLRELTPDLRTLGEIEVRGFIVTAQADQANGHGYDYALRYFGPRVGVPEDPVTGTAHCALGPYWSLRSRDRRRRFMAYQASARGGFVKVQIDGDRVHIGGAAVTVMRGELLA